MIASSTKPTATAWLALALRIVVGAVLAYAGFSKAMGPSAEFAATIDAYRILPPAFIPPLAMALPWIEMWLGLFLMSGFYTGQAAAGACVLFLVFLTALTSSILRGLNLVSCGCFGSDRFSPHQTLWIDLVLLLISVWLVSRRRQPQVLAFENL